ncbi:hypothetical protein SDC9_203842 [bioreactor metagenome]|uniref:Uncharacterized protein n=1 Tax=bioreactor metagenome TaxID=1076179 RepID=A0A645IY87_9ZZZZ
MDVAEVVDLVVGRQQLLCGHSQNLAVDAGLVFHLQDADGTAGHDHTAGQGEGSHHQHVHGVAVASQGLGHIAVVHGVVHGCAHETVHEQAAGFLVHFVLHGSRVGRDFDDDVEDFRRRGAGGHIVQRHDGWEK